jgi:hypothetical protein
MAKAVAAMSGFGKSIENFFSSFTTRRPGNTGIKTKPKVGTHAKFEERKGQENLNQLKGYQGFSTGEPSLMKAPKMSLSDMRK